MTIVPVYAAMLRDSKVVLALPCLKGCNHSHLGPRSAALPQKVLRATGGVLSLGASSQKVIKCREM